MIEEDHVVKLAYVQEVDIQKSNDVDLELEKGENLMLRRVLVKELVKEEAKQRRELFRTMCKILGKVCKVIIDSGSIDNVISKEANKNLGLKKFHMYILIG